MNLNTKQLFMRTNTSVCIPVANFVLIFDSGMQRKSSPCPLWQQRLRKFISGTKNKRGVMENYNHPFFCLPFLQCYFKGSLPLQIKGSLAVSLFFYMILNLFYSKEKLNWLLLVLWHLTMRGRKKPIQ